MLSEKEAYLSSVKKRLLQYEKAGVKLYLDGNPSDTDHIMKKCVKEDAAYMADYIADETGKVKEIRYDLISEPIMNPVSDTIPLDPLEY